MHPVGHRCVQPAAYIVLSCLWTHRDPTYLTCIVLTAPPRAGVSVTCIHASQLLASKTAAHFIPTHVRMHFLEEQVIHKQHALRTPLAHHSIMPFMPKLGKASSA